MPLDPGSMVIATYDGHAPSVTGLNCAQRQPEDPCDTRELRAYQPGQFCRRCNLEDWAAALALAQVPFTINPDQISSGTPDSIAGVIDTDAMRASTCTAYFTAAAITIAAAVLRSWAREPVRELITPELSAMRIFGSTKPLPATTYAVFATVPTPVAAWAARYTTTAARLHPAPQVQFAVAPVSSDAFLEIVEQLLTDQVDPAEVLPTAAALAR